MSEQSQRKCSVQIVDLSGERPKHYRKVTLLVGPEDVEEKLSELFGGQVVSRKKAAETPAIGAEKPHTGRVKGEGEDLSE